MKQVPEWIWIFGDFENYHRLLVDTRRTERNYVRPAPWPLEGCAHNVRFQRTYELTAPTQFRALADGMGNVNIDGHRHELGIWIEVPAGKHTIDLNVANVTGLPSAYAEGEVICTNADWTATCDFFRYEPVGCAGFTDPQSPPSVFQFAYAPQPLHTFTDHGRTIYDAGKETFCRLLLRFSGTGRARVCYGESRQEICDESAKINIFLDIDVQPEVVIPAYAFRYLRFEVPDTATLTAVQAEYEYVPLPDRGTFHCSDAELNRIWDVAAWTLHLNAREFFLDGIKRDRYLWSGDAYQSYLMNYYIFFDNALCTRTMLALRGKDPMVRHINTIMDYSFYWVLAMKDYLRYTGDLEFIRRVFPKIERLLQFCIGRANADGMLEGLPGDWIFIDWADLDKTGPNAAEQILFVASLEAAAELGRKLDMDVHEYDDRAAQLRRLVETRFWDEEKGAYIDSFTSGRRWVTRQSNLFALRFGFDGNGRREKIVRNVLLNDEVPQITTPYFKFYELEALAELGNTNALLARIHDYWGGMLQLGATSFWEEYKPTLQPDEHYSMYGDPYGKSLCHAWGASPIYLLGRFVLGVTPTADGYGSFTVAPHVAGLDTVEGTVPTPRGDIRVQVTPEYVEAAAPFEGGTLVWQGQRAEIPADAPVRVARG